MTVASFYDLPDVYAALLEVGADEFRQVAALLADHQVRHDSVLDPACGPGGWLVPFRDAGCRVAGNDLRQEMVDAAHRRLPCGEFTAGDMTNLRLCTGPFDLAINLSASVGHLKDDQDVARHLMSVRAHLVPGGAYLLEVSSPSQLRTRPRTIWSSRKVPVPGGGQAKVSYRSLLADPDARVERISLELKTWGVPAAPARLVESYELRTFPEDVLRTLAGGADLTVERLIRTEGDDVLALLRR
jgi:SAM-dependent methyltransferase